MVRNICFKRTEADLTRYSLLEPGRRVVCSQSLTGFILSRGLVILLLSFSVMVVPTRYFADTQFRSTRSRAHSSSCRASRCVVAAWIAPATGSVTTCSMHACCLCISSHRRATVASHAAEKYLNNGCQDISWSVRCPVGRHSQPQSHAASLLCYCVKRRAATVIAVRMPGEDTSRPLLYCARTRQRREAQLSFCTFMLSLAFFDPILLLCRPFCISLNMH